MGNISPVNNVTDAPNDVLYHGFVKRDTRVAWVILSSFTLILILVFIVACDPGMTIRQRDPIAATGTNQKPSFVTIRVRTAHLMVGDSWYAAPAEVSNLSSLPITITRVELVVRGTTFQNSPRRSGTYPMEVAPGSTAPLDTWFDLNGSLKKTFHEETELRVYYQSENKESIARATLIGGPSGR